jgi:glucokinase
MLLILNLSLMNKKVMIGIDMGGTKIMTGIIDLAGNILGTPVKIPTRGNDPADIIMNRIYNSVRETLANAKLSIDDITGIGIGSTGPLSIKNGTILDCPQLPTMNHFPIRAEAEREFNVPVYLNNDANCLIYGETIFGSATGKQSVLGFTLGTGIGCAIVLGGKIWNGATETAGEIWTSPYKGGTIEDYVSGSGVSKIYKQLAGKQKSSHEIFKLAEKGDGKALQTWIEFGEHLAVAISWTTNLFDPELIVLGGSITGAADYFMPSLERTFQKFICSEPAEKTKIVLAQLGDYAGFIGAACLVLNHESK